MTQGVATEPTETDSQTSPETMTQDVCPLCEFAGEKHTDVYVHLQTAHRKSALATALLDGPTEL
jgi:hypothetical protein